MNSIKLLTEKQTPANINVFNGKYIFFHLYLYEKLFLQSIFLRVSRLWLKYYSIMRNPTKKLCNLCAGYVYRFFNRTNGTLHNTDWPQKMFKKINTNRYHSLAYCQALCLIDETCNIVSIVMNDCYLGNVNINQSTFRSNSTAIVYGSFGITIMILFLHQKLAKFPFIVIQT